MRRLGPLALLILLLSAVAPPAAAAPSIQMTAQAANEGRVKQGSWVTVLVDLVNQGGATEGEVVVEADDDDVGGGGSADVQYAVPYTLPAGGRKRIAVSLPNPGNWPVEVTLYAEGSLVEHEQVSLTWLPVRSLLAGVLSGDELGVPGLSQLQAGGSAAQVVRLTAESLPDSATLLADFDLIALSRFDTATLSAAQLRALEVWVARGGTLLLAGGPEWRRTLGPLPERLLPVAVADVREVSLAPLGDLAGVPLEGSGAVSAGELVRGRALLQSGDVVLAAMAPSGSGRVVYVAFDPGLTPIVGWQGQGALMRRMVGDAGEDRVAWEASEWRLQTALQAIPDWGLPAVWTVGLLLLGYLLAVGPVNYLVLRRFDRREWTWLTVPVLALAFLGGVYFSGSGRFRSGISHLVTLTEVTPEAGAGVMSAYVGLYAPGRTQLSVTVPDARLVRPLIGGPAGGGGGSARVTAGDRTTIQLRGLNNYSMSGYAVEQDVAVAGGLELVDVASENGKVTARLRNGLGVAVEGVEVATDRQAVTIGALAPGQTSEPFAVSLGTGVPSEVKGPMLPEPWAYDGDWDPRRDSLRSYLWESVSPRLSGSLLVTGWTAEPLAEPPLPDLGRLVEGANLVYAVHRLPIGEDGDIPAGILLGRPDDPSAVTWTPSGYYAPAGTHLFTLLLPPLDPARVAEVAVDLQSAVGPDVTAVSARNQRTGEWLTLTERRTVLPDWQDYVSPGGAIELRYEVRSDVEIPAPTVAVKGVSR